MKSGVLQSLETQVVTTNELLFHQVPNFIIVIELGICVYKEQELIKKT